LNEEEKQNDKTFTGNIAGNMEYGYHISIRSRSDYIALVKTIEKIRTKNHISTYKDRDGKTMGRKNKMIKNKQKIVIMTIMKKYNVNWLTAGLIAREDKLI